MSEAKPENGTAARPYIGGQAVLEGVMMRSPKSFAVAVRRADGSISIRERPVTGGVSKWAKVPLARGVATLVESLKLGSVPDQLYFIFVCGAGENVMVDGALHADFDLFGVERLDDVIECAHLHRLDRALNFGDCAHDYYWRGRRYCCGAADYAIAINFRHHQVGKYYRITIRLNLYQCLFAVIGIVALVILRQEFAHHVAGIVIIVYDQKRKVLQKGSRLIG
jgi:hypothetical protein